MSPHQYTTTIVLPTVREFLAERGDRRRAFLACVAVYHLIDHLAAARGLTESSKWVGRKLREADAKRIRQMLGMDCKLPLEVVQGICNGTKHADLVEVRDVPAFAWDVPGAGWDQGRWDMPGLEVEHGCQKLFVDWCVQVVMLTLRAQHGDLLDAIDLTFFDTAVREQLG